MLDDAEWIRFEDELIVDEPAGKSHRWRYNFYGKPTFLSCYWLETGLPIRPAKDNLEKLLFPEGIQASIDDYEAALLAMVVDYPFNHHNVNQLKNRYIIVQQVKRSMALGIDAEIILKLSRIRPKGNEPVPFPSIAVWRRQKVYVDLDRYEPTWRAAKDSLESQLSISVHLPKTKGICYFFWFSKSKLGSYKP